MCVGQFESISKMPVGAGVGSGVGSGVGAGVGAGFGTGSGAEYPPPPPQAVTKTKARKI